MEYALGVSFGIFFDASLNSSIELGNKVFRMEDFQD